MTKRCEFFILNKQLFTKTTKMQADGLQHETQMSCIVSFNQLYIYLPKKYLQIEMCTIWEPLDAFMLYIKLPSLPNGN